MDDNVNIGQPSNRIKDKSQNESLVREGRVVEGIKKKEMDKMCDVGQS